MIDVIYIFSQMFVIAGIIVCLFTLIARTPSVEPFEGLRFSQTITGVISIILLIEFFTSNILHIEYFDIIIFSIFIGCLIVGIITKEYTNKYLILFLSIIAILTIFYTYSRILETNKYLSMFKQDISQLNTQEKFKLVGHIKKLIYINNKDNLYDSIKKQIEEELLNTNN